jgi:hypothetical protein
MFDKFDIKSTDTRLDENIITRVKHTQCHILHQPLFQFRN